MSRAQAERTLEMTNELEKFFIGRPAAPTPITFARKFARFSVATRGILYRSL